MKKNLNLFTSETGFDLQLFAEDNPEPQKSAGEQNTNPTVTPPVEQTPTTSKESSQTPPEAAPTTQPTAPKLADLTPEVRNMINEMVARARQEEKDKLYPTVDSLKGQIKQKDEQLTQRDTQLSQLQKTVDGFKAAEPKKNSEPVPSKKGENKMPEDLVTTLQQQVADLAKQVQAQVAQKAQEELNAYRTQQMAGIPSEFASLIPATSKEAIDAAINGIKSGMEKLTPAPQQTPTRSGSLLTAGIRLPGAPNAGVNLQGPQELTADTINGMTPEEFAQFRQQNPGMFGSSQRIGFAGFGGSGLRRQ